MFSLYYEYFEEWYIEKYSRRILIRLMLCLYLLFGICIIIILLHNFSDKDDNLAIVDYTPCLIICIIAFVLTILISIDVTRRRINKVYGINIKWYKFWKSPTSEDYYRVRAEAKFHMKSKFQEEKMTIYRLQNIITFLEKEIEKEKPKFPIIPSFIGALFVSIFNVYFTEIFKASGIKKVQDNLMNGVLIIFFILVSTISGKYIYKGIKKSLFSEKYYRLTYFNEILNEVLCDMVDKENNQKKERRIYI